ncbi:YdcH family protein [uncultured Thiodictyon sp.]|uniref:YdcH family protein n=1 Tax=uncultured Thiodictyon sp. TaxID=1846217 RepID=UPI0025F9B8F5|nr:YdcH family protein [uncultured Thiodictyon sp.]
MLGEPHNLLHEFPELEGKIEGLRASNPDFAQLMNDYDDLDSRVRQLEELGIPVADETIEELKKERLVLKDRLYRILHG